MLLYKCVEYFGEKMLLYKLLNWIFLKKLIQNNLLNWMLTWNEWMNRILNHYFQFLIKSPLFGLFWTLLGSFLIQPVSMIPWQLIWIIFWIESPEFILNWILVWIEFWVSNTETNIELNHFFGKIQTLNWIW